MENKYMRKIKAYGTNEEVQVDVYCVLEAFEVTCPARQHAIKKLLCAGLRGKGDAVQDLQETAVAVNRAIELEQGRYQNLFKTPPDEKVFKRTGSQGTVQTTPPPRYRQTVVEEEGKGDDPSWHHNHPSQSIEGVPVGEFVPCGPHEAQQQPRSSSKVHSIPRSEIYRDATPQPYK